MGEAIYLGHAACGRSQPILGAEQCQCVFWGGQSSPPTGMKRDRQSHPILRSCFEVTAIGENHVASGLALRLRAMHRSRLDSGACPTIAGPMQELISAVMVLCVSQHLCRPRRPSTSIPDPEHINSKWHKSVVAFATSLQTAGGRSKRVNGTSGSGARCRQPTTALRFWNSDPGAHHPSTGAARANPRIPWDVHHRQLQA